MLYSLVTSYFLSSAPSTLNAGIGSLALKLQFSCDWWHKCSNKNPIAFLLPLSGTRICIDNLLTLCMNRYPGSWAWFGIWNNGTSTASISSLPLKSVLHSTLDSLICMLILWKTNLLPISQVVIQITILFYPRGLFEVFALTFFYLICSTN